MKVLIVQDFRQIGRKEAQLIRESGHQVTWVTGFANVEALEGILPDGSKVEVGSDFDVAIVDGQIDGPSGKVEDLGPAVVARLSRSGVKCVANSTQPGFNDEMVAAGAFRAVNQLVLFVALVVGKLVTVEDLLQPSPEAEALLDMDLASFMKTGGPGAEFRSAADLALLGADE